MTFEVDGTLNQNAIFQSTRRPIRNPSEVVFPFESDHKDHPGPKKILV
jgi:hypothetical protein